MHQITVYLEDTQLVKDLKMENEKLRNEMERLQRELNRAQIALIDEMNLSFRLSDEKKELEKLVRDYRNGTDNK